MNITIIHGSERQGSTYHIAQAFVDHLKTEGDTVTSFFLPRDMNAFCIGCAQCFSAGEQACPHAAQTEPIHQAMVEADLLIFTTPVYVLRASGQMKTLLDHFAYLFMTHRPDKQMFSKTAVVFSTGAGGGTKSAMKDITTSLRFWGVAKIHTVGSAVFASDWAGVDDKRKQKLMRHVQKLAKQVKPTIGQARAGMRTRVLFEMFRLFQLKFGYCPLDVTYWQEAGWLGKGRPWKRA